MFTVFFKNKGKNDFKVFETEEEVRDFHMGLNKENQIFLIQDTEGNTIEIKGVSVR